MTTMCYLQFSDPVLATEGLPTVRLSTVTPVQLAGIRM